MKLSKPKLFYFLLCASLLSPCLQGVAQETPADLSWSMPAEKEKAAARSPFDPILDRESARRLKDVRTAANALDAAKARHRAKAGESNRQGLYIAHIGFMRAATQYLVFKNDVLHRRQLALDEAIAELRPVRDSLAAHRVAAAAQPRRPSTVSEPNADTVAELVGLMARMEDSPEEKVVFERMRNLLEAGRQVELVLRRELEDADDAFRQTDTIYAELMAARETTVTQRHILRFAGLTHAMRETEAFERMAGRMN